MSLLEDVQKIVDAGNSGDRVWQNEAHDADIVADEIGTIVMEDNMRFGDMRWGSIQGYVLGRDDEYVKVTFYSYSGDGDGDPDFEARAVVPRQVVTTEWDKL